MYKPICLILLCCLIGCDLKKKEYTEIKEPPGTIVGKWVCNLVYYNIMNYDSTLVSDFLKGPFNGYAGLIEYVKFTPNMVYIKMGDKPDLKVAKYIYMPEQYRLLVIDSIEVDTYTVVTLTASKLQFFYNESDTLNGRVRRAHYNYQAYKQ